MGALHEKSAQQITTYTIDINRGTNRRLGWTALLLQSMARLATASTSTLPAAW